MVAAIDDALARNALASEPGITMAATTPLGARAAIGMHSTPCVVRTNDDDGEFADDGTTLRFVVDFFCDKREKYIGIVDQLT